MRPSKIIAIAGLLLLVAAGVAVYFLWAGKRSSPAGSSGDLSSSDSSSGLAEPHRVVAMGRLEPDGGVIDISGPIGDRLLSLNVHEGQWVEAGEELGRLESYALRKAEYDVAQLQYNEAVHRKQAEKEYSDAMLAEAKLDARQLESIEHDVAAQRAKVAVLEKNAQLAKKNLERMKALDESLVSAQELERQTLAVDQAQAELTAGNGTLDKLLQSQQLGNEQARAKLATANANAARLDATVPLESLKKSLELAQMRLSTSVLKAPRAGKVLKILTHVGEAVGQRPVLRLGDTRKIYAVAEVYETFIREVQIGDSAMVSSEVFPRNPQLGNQKAIAARVESIGLMVAKNEVSSLDPTARNDLRVVQVRVLLLNNEVAQGLINLEVEVSINPGSKDSDRQPAAATVGARHRPDRLVQ